LGDPAATDPSRVLHGFDRLADFARDPGRKVLGWTPKRSAEFGVEEIIDKLKEGTTDKTAETVTLQWYRELEKWYSIIKELEMYGGILNIRVDEEEELLPFVKEKSQ
jgi:hypothetical protein